PILLNHLERGGYPDKVMESVGRALAVTAASFAWDRLKELYLRADGPGEQEGLAVALAGAATPDRFNALVGLLYEESRGASRIIFLRRIKEFGGEKGRTILESLASDPLFGSESRALLSSDESA